MRKALASILLATLAGCSLRLPFTDNDLSKLRRERNEWRALAIHDYTYDFRESCFCPPDIIDPVRIEVRADTVSSVVNLRTQGTMPRIRTLYSGTWPTIDSVFARVEQAYEYGQYKTTIDYDGTYHFPISFSGDIPNALDAGFKVTATNFVKKQ